MADPICIDERWRMRENEPNEISLLIDQVRDQALRPDASLVLFGATQVASQIASILSVEGMSCSLIGICDLDPGRQGATVGGHIVCAPDSVQWERASCVVVTENAGKDGVLDWLVSSEVTKSLADMAVLAFGQDHFSFSDQIFWQLVQTGTVPPAAGGYRNIVPHLFQCLQALAESNPGSAIIECGVGKGGTSELLARSMDALGLSGDLWLLDTFGGFPDAKSVLDSYSFANDAGYRASLVAKLVEPYANTYIIEGDISETAPRHLATLESEVGLCFIDVDNYAPAAAILDAIIDRIVVGGFIVFDHFYSPQWTGPLGERAAALRKMSSTQWLNLHGTGVFVKRR